MKENGIVDVSVIICTANRPALLSKQLESILSSDVWPKEIIIVDQGNAELTAEILDGLKARYAPIEHILDHGRGASRARNIGWRAASAEIIAFTDDDACVSDRWLQVGFQHMLAHTDTGILGGPIIAVPEGGTLQIDIPIEFRYILPEYTQSGSIGPFLGGARPPAVNYWTRKSLLLRTGGFNEKLGPVNARKIQIYGEDSDLTQRIDTLGLKIMYHPDLMVYHPVPLIRQTEDFLKKRILTEGITSAVLWRTKENSGRFFPFLKATRVLAGLILSTMLQFGPSGTAWRLRGYYFRGALFGLCHYGRMMDDKGNSIH